MVLFSRSFVARCGLQKKLYLSASLNSSTHKSSEPLSSGKEPQSTVDPKDIQKHAESGNKWWDANGPIKALHSFNQIRVPFIRDGMVQCSFDERTEKPLNGKTILDVGCGGGILSEALARVGAQVTGIDAGQELIDIAREHCKIDPKIQNNKPQYIFTTIEEHVQTHKNHYDAVVASEVIEHVNDKELFVKSCVEALKPGGRVFFTTPTRTPISRVFGIYVAEYVLKLLPKGTHQYEKFTTPAELSFLLERNNCHVEIIYGIIYNPLSNSWRFIGSTQLLFALQAVKIK